VRIVSLVEAYAAQAGVTDLRIRYTGLRPGEKLNETLFDDAEQRVPTAHPRITAAWTGVPDDLEAGLAELYAAAAENDTVLVRERMARLLPGYTPPAVAEPAGALRMFDWPYPDGF
jgi:FlaA1/EpsC-like NDP-sugar epimerase